MVEVHGPMTFFIFFLLSFNVIAIKKLCNSSLEQLFLATFKINCMIDSYRHKNFAQKVCAEILCFEVFKHETLFAYGTFTWLKLNGML